MTIYDEVPSTGKYACSSNSARTRRVQQNVAGLGLQVPRKKTTIMRTGIACVET